ncbi:DUF6098 family protein [Streptomyces sp. NPDC046557]|uniref:DUF6098 family protein n=1 Tax=Streptomyces sp. NPDC046557 TaxID=3155372 RepID=UPI0033E822AC
MRTPACSLVAPLHGERAGPDNVPLVTDVQPIGWIDRAVIEESTEEISRRQHRGWGPRDRSPRSGNPRRPAGACAGLSRRSMPVNRCPPVRRR